MPAPTSCPHHPTVVVFVGPTISVEEAKGQLSAARYLPPVAQGDVYRATLSRPDIIGIIDGYFSHQPAVWHKEILWALSNGVHVFGAASMGALRAAELEPFGMEGIGSIFEDYRDGRLEDDDEVAVAHLDGDMGFRQVSDAMVNIRATLVEAVNRGIITRATGTALERMAKSLWYPDRTFRRILELGSESGLPKTQLGAFEETLAQTKIDRKKEDALGLLHHLGRLTEEGVGPKQVNFRFHRTGWWEAACQAAGEHPTTDEADPEELSTEALLDELRLLGPEAYETAYLAALGRSLALSESYRRGLELTDELTDELMRDYRRHRELDDVSALGLWSRENGLNQGGLGQFLASEARVRWVARTLATTAVRSLPDYLRVAGLYPRLSARAKQKSRALASGLFSADEMEPSAADAVVDWYFRDRLDREVPTELEVFTRAAGFRSTAHFMRAVRREYLFHSALESAVDSFAASEDHGTNGRDPNESSSVLTAVRPERAPSSS